MKPLPSGMIVQIKTQAVIVKNTHPLNPYWYRIQHPDGRQDVVHLSRLCWEEKSGRELAGRGRKFPIHGLLTRFFRHGARPKR